MPHSLKSKVKSLCYKGEITEKERDRLIQALEQQPKKGKWDEEHEPFTWMGYTRWSCSCCGFKCGYELEIRSRTNYCPNCGADMRGDSE